MYWQLAQILTCVISKISPISKTMLPPFIKAEGAKTAESQRPSSGCGRPVSDCEKGHSGMNKGVECHCTACDPPVGNHLRGTPGRSPLLLPPNIRFTASRPGTSELESAGSSDLLQSCIPITKSCFEHTG